MSKVIFAVLMFSICTFTATGNSYAGPHGHHIHHPHHHPHHVHHKHHKGHPSAQHAATKTPSVNLPSSAPSSAQ